MSVSNTKSILLVITMLAFGSWNTICSKLQYQTCAPTLHPPDIPKGQKSPCPEGQTLFRKPWQVNMYMFIGEATLLLVYGVQKRLRARRQQALEAERPQQVEDNAEQAKPPSFFVFALPAFCDVFGTGLAACGQVLIDPAIWQMLRSSIIVFSAFCSILLLKRRLQPFHWVAVGIVFVGLVIVGIATVLDGGSGSSGAGGGEQILGMALTVGAQLCSAFQIVFEEKLLTGKAKVSAKKAVGCEGVFGMTYMVIILALMNVAPGPDGGVYNSTPDGIHMITGSPMLLFLSVSYMMSIATYNLVGMTVGKKLSGVVRCLVDSCRTVVVWAISLLLYYFVGEEYGSAWGAHSWLTVIGFLLLVLGTLLYNELLPVPAQLMSTSTTDQALMEQGIEGSYHSTRAGGSFVADPLLCKLEFFAEEGTDDKQASLGRQRSVSADTGTRMTRQAPIA